MQRNKFFAIFIHVIIPVLAGTGIYCFFRSKQMMVINFFPMLFSNMPLLNSPEWFKYNLPDALWLYGLLSAMILIWDNKLTSQSFLWFGLVVCATLLSEILQHYAVFPGTFDWKDLLSYGISSLACIFHFTNKFRMMFPVKN
ncbi:MAG TPA: hypothetical protein VI461_10005 [Chitinophagaceae bacterium]|nr:hypothetical protein [Chitinophagaceae bacterium]